MAKDDNLSGQDEEHEGVLLLKCGDDGHILRGETGKLVLGEGTNHEWLLNNGVEDAVPVVFVQSNQNVDIMMDIDGERRAALNEEHNDILHEAVGVYLWEVLKGRDAACTGGQVGQTD